MGDRVTSKDVLQGLMVKHSGPEWATFCEVANSTGIHANRRIDFLALNIWPSKGYAIHGFEIKVSRGDFRREMENIAKAKAISQFCDFFWLATPSGLIDPTECPENWGLIELTKAGMRVKKQAPKRTPEDLTRGFVAAILRQTQSRHEPEIQAAVDRRVEALQKGMDQRLAYEKKQMESRVAQNAEWIKAFEKKLGVKFQHWTPPERLAERLKAAAMLDKGGSIQRLKHSLTTLLQEIDRLEEDHHET